MIVLPSERTKLIASEIPGPGKRSLPPKKSLKKQTKNLNLNSKNPLLSTWDTTTTTEDLWDQIFLEASVAVPKPPEESEFEIPAALEAFAEKIGLGMESELTKEWTDLEVPSTTAQPVRPNSPLFYDYPTEKETMEDVWNLVSPAEVEGRQATGTTMEQSDNSYNNQTEESEVIQPEIAETEFNIPELDSDVLDAFLSGGHDLPSTMMEVDRTEPLAVPEGVKFDIVQFAMGESGLATEAELGQMKPVNNVTIEIIEEETEAVIEHKKIKLEPNHDQMEPNNNLRNRSIEVKKRKKAGRPINQEPITVTEIPVESKLSDLELKALKYRRTRDLNNKASRRFRMKKKEEEDNNQQELLELEAYNKELKMKLKQMEKEVAIWQARVASQNNNHAR